MKDNEKKWSGVCPVCGKVYTGCGAVSRADGVTLICGDCGTRQALDEMGISADEQEAILKIIHKHTRR